MRRAIIGSAVLHIAIIVSTMIAWPHAVLPAQDSPDIIPVELVTIADQTNIKATTAVEPPKQPQEQPPEPQPEAQSAPPPDAEVAPDEKPVPPKEQEKEAEATPPPPTVRPREKPEPDKKPDKFNVDSILALLDQKTPKPQTPPPNAEKTDRTQKGVGMQSAQTMNEIDALRTEVSKCWNPPIGAVHAEQLVVDFDLFLNPDGTVQRLDRGSTSATGSYAQAAIEAARRAILECAPYKLPANDYSNWREINPFHFDPSKMVGG
jgi:outer membrane biosynthesis protein TonB